MVDFWNTLPEDGAGRCSRNIQEYLYEHLTCQGVEDKQPIAEIVQIDLMGSTDTEYVCCMTPCLYGQLSGWNHFLVHYIAGAMQHIQNGEHTVNDTGSQ